MNLYGEKNNHIRHIRTYKKHTSMNLYGEKNNHIRHIRTYKKHTSMNLYALYGRK